QSLARIVDHRQRLRYSLGRDPGLPVATFDYFINVDTRLSAPRMVEMRKYQEMERQAETDELTGLMNRRAFEQVAREELRRSGRYGLSVSILFLDLDDFKDTNDFLGHHVGDLVLREVALIISSAVREVDIGCRYGGEEFAVLLPETARGGAVSVAERIRQRVEERFAGRGVDGHMVRMTVSGGIASFASDGQDLETLMCRADEALYAAKSYGKNRVVTAFAERRGSQRFDLSALPVSSILRVARGEGISPAISMARNISRSGALIEAHEPLPLGAPVFLRFEHHDANRPEVIVEGRVVRHGEMVTGEGRRFELGINFDGAGSEQWELLRKVLSIEPTGLEEDPAS
ncbi:MAG: diguanylate cyclase, partial [Thermoplasmata archaeon]